MITGGWWLSHQSVNESDIVLPLASLVTDTAILLWRSNVTFCLGPMLLFLGPMLLFFKSNVTFLDPMLLFKAQSYFFRSNVTFLGPMCTKFHIFCCSFADSSIHYNLKSISRCILESGIITVFYINSWSLQFQNLTFWLRNSKHLVNDELYT